MYIHISFFIEKENFNRNYLVKFKSKFSKKIAIKDPNNIFDFYYKKISFLLRIGNLNKDPIEITLSLGNFFIPQSFNELLNMEEKKENLKTVIEVIKKLWNSFEKKPILAVGDTSQYGIPLLKENSEYNLTDVLHTLKGVGSLQYE